MRKCCGPLRRDLPYPYRAIRPDGFRLFPQRTKEPVPEREQVSEITLLRGVFFEMMDAMQPGRNEDEPRRVFQPLG